MTDREPTPMQPIEFDEEGIVRFRKNRIVDDLLVGDRHLDLNQIALLTSAGRYSVEEYEQFNQLIGYSVCGYFDLGLVTEESKDAAEKIMNQLTEAAKPMPQPTRVPARTKGLKVPTPPPRPARPEDLQLFPQWMKFLRGHWTTVAPTKPGLYPTADRDGERGSDFLFFLDAHGNLSGVPGIVGGTARHRGWWWSEPRPELPPAPKEWPTGT